MNLTYIGTSDFRQIDTSAVAADVWPEGTRHQLYTWEPGSTVDVEDSLAEWLLEFHPNDFRKTESIASHHLTRDQLLEKARVRNITGRSSMTKDELISAIDEYDREVGAPDDEDSAVSNELADAQDASMGAHPEASQLPYETQGIPARGASGDQPSTPS